MIIVIDSNEYIDYFNKKAFLLNKIINNGDITIYIDETIIKEVLRNIDEKIKREFYKLLFKNNITVHYEKLSYSLLEKYKKLGLKKGDIKIAALCDRLNSEYLISENRDFLKAIKFEKLRVLTINEFVKEIGL